MRRREFISLIGGVAGTWPLAVQAQQSARKIRRIGYISMTPLPPDEAFRQALRELGYTEGQDIVIEFHWITPSGRTASQEAGELVRSKPDVIVAVSSPPTRAVKDATSTIPIVFADIGDPVAYGFVTNLERAYHQISWRSGPKGSRF